MRRKCGLGREHHGFANQRFAHTQRLQSHILQVNLDRQARRTVVTPRRHRLTQYFHVGSSYPACPEHPGKQRATAPVSLGVRNARIDAFTVRKRNRCNARRSRPHTADTLDFNAALITRSGVGDNPGKQVQPRPGGRQEADGYNHQKQQRRKAGQDPPEYGFALPEHVRSVLHCGLYGHSVRC